MVTAYYISRLSRPKKFEIEDYYKDLTKTIYLKAGDSTISSRCRVCLKPSTVSIFDNESPSDVLEALKTFGDIAIEQDDDDFSKSLCSPCDMFIKTAILFRKKAKQTEAALKQYKYFKIKTNDGLLQCQDFNEKSDEIDARTKTDEDWPTEDLTDFNFEIDVEKKVRPKVTCRFCGKRMNKKYYREHLQLHNPNAHQWVCEICGKSFKIKSFYHTHRSRHRTDFAFKCSQCPYRGRTKELLKIHMHKHSSEYSFMCTECPARFKFKTNLTAHMFKHKEPRFKCDSCQRTFHYKIFLQRHVEADHLGVLNHVCNICGKAFGYQKAMMKHLVGVHKKKKSTFGRRPAYLAESQQQEHDTSYLNL